MLHIKKASLNWALKHALKFGDTDVFPDAFEYRAVKHDWRDLSTYLLGVDVDTWATRPPRALLSPKSKYGFRIITQLDPLDFLIFAALVHEIGKDLECARIPTSEKRVFSHRFKPESDGRMYNSDIGYVEFQQRAQRLASAANCTHVAVTDIADFYPRIYSHRLENALSACTSKRDQVRGIQKLLAGWNETESHGIPVGSAPARLLAEITINDVDQALIAHNIRFIRFSDDYRIFCRKRSEAFRQLAVLAQILYENHGLTLQPQKTSILKSDAFRRIYLSSPEDRELDELHSQFAKVLSELGIDDPYEVIDYDGLSSEQRELVDSLNLQGLFSDEIAKSEPDLAIIRFILRRLGQLGDDCLVDPILDNIELLHPAFCDIIGYFRNLRHASTALRRSIGEKLLDLVDESMISELPFYRMWAFSLFTHSTEWDNEHRFQGFLNTSIEQFGRRELILAMGRAHHQHWFQSQWRHLFDEPSWPRRALLVAMSCMAGDAPKHWYKSITARLDPLERAVVKWARENPF